MHEDMENSVKESYRFSSASWGTQELIDREDEPVMFMHDGGML